MSAISWEQALNVSNLTPSRGNRVELKDLFLRPKAPDAKGEEQEYTIWILQSPHPYIVHWPNKLDDEGKRVDVSFPDQEYTKMTSRVCHKTIVKDDKGNMGLDKHADCPWCKGGYNAQLKYMLNVYDADEKTIRILDVTAKIVDEISKEIKRLATKEKVVVRPGDWSSACPYFIITATRQSGKNAFGSGSVEYRVTSTRADREVDQDIIDAIVAINPEAAENCEEVLDYKKYLHSLERWTAPTLVATAEDAERRESGSRVKEDEDNLENLSPRTKVSEQPKASLKKKVQVVEEDEDEAFDDDSSW